MNKGIQRISLLLMSALALIALAACSTKKNTAANRKYQAFITKYNIHYNGNKHFIETLDEMEKKYEDDYSSRLFMHPVEAKGREGVPQPSGDFNYSIEKAQKAIQLRSIKTKPKRKPGKGNDPEYKAWLNREEYNPFLHNSWLMMGRGQYYNGDFGGAASTFMYISRHFKWLPAVVSEAKIMEAMSYLGMGWLFEAEVILMRIKKEELTDRNLQKIYNFAMADYYVRSDKYTEAVPYLEKAAADASGAQRTRLNFLLGQVESALGHKDAAYKAFSKAADASSAQYRTKFNARIKQSEVFQGSKIEPEVKALKSMAKYDRNKDYLDQLYYAIGNLYLSRRDTAKAIENYILANEKSTRKGIDKALNQLQLGAIYFDRHNYVKAQPSYAEAVPLLPKNYAGYDSIKRRSDVLDEMALYAGNVVLQDSLLRLAAMPEKERNAVIDNIIKQLKEKEEKEAEERAREEFEATKQSQPQALQDQNARSFNINADNSWYFYNTATKNAGKTDFQKRWGSRKLEDNWRRRNKASFNVDEFADNAPAAGSETTDGNEATDNAATDAPALSEDEKRRAADPHYPEYYIAQLPLTEEAKRTSHDVIQEGLFNSATILKDKLEDFDAARSQYKRLLGEYPDNTYRLDTYYNMYLMDMRQGRKADADRWVKLIIKEFPSSDYATAMADPNYIENLRNMEKNQEALYEKAYEAYLNNDNTLVHSTVEELTRDYPLSKIRPKFLFLEALTQITEKNIPGFNATLRELLDKYPDTDITPVASAWLKGMAQGRTVEESNGNLRGMIWDLKLSNDSIDGSASQERAQFLMDENQPQLLVFSFATDEVPSNALLYEIARHNFRSFVVKNFELEPINYGRLGMIVVRGFANMAELKHYRRVMADSQDFKLPDAVRPIVISEHNFKILIDEHRSFEEYFQYLQELNDKAMEPLQNPKK